MSKMLSKGTVAFMASPGKLEYQEFDLPALGRGEILVKVTQTNVCGSELHIWEGSMPRTQLGHEFVGVVAELGEGVTTDCAGRPLSVGDRVTATYFNVCGKCYFCAKGDFESCENFARYTWQPPEKGHPFKHSFATHYLVEADQYFYKVPDNIPDAVAAGANCAISQVLYGLHRVHLSVGESIVIQGAGGLGLYGCAIAHESGAKVIIIDGVESRLAQAKKFGADYTISMKEFDTVEKRAERVKELTGGRGADVVMEVTGVPAAFVEGISHVRKNGRYLSMGNVTLGTKVEIDPTVLTKLQATIQPVNRYHPWFLDKTLQFLSSTIEKYPYLDMMDDKFNFEQIADALDQSVARTVTRATIRVA